MLKAYARWVTGHAVLVLIASALVTVAALAELVDFRAGRLRLQIDTSIEQMLPSGDENRAFYDRMRKLFGNDETLLLVVHRPDGIFTTDVLAGIERLSERVEDVEGVASVLSLATAPNVSSAGRRAEHRAALRDGAHRSGGARAHPADGRSTIPLYVGAHDRDGRTTTSLVIQLLDIPEPEFTRLEPVDFAAALAREARSARASASSPSSAIDKQIQALAAEEFGPGVADLAGRQRAHQGRDHALPDPRPVAGDPARASC